MAQKLLEPRWGGEGPVARDTCLFGIRAAYQSEGATVRNSGHLPLLSSLLILLLRLSQTGWATQGVTAQCSNATGLDVSRLFNASSTHPADNPMTSYSVP